MKFMNCFFHCENLKFNIEISMGDLQMVIHEIESKEIIVKSKLPGADYVINPYTGCSHRCQYCYACFMKRFTKHTEPWGEFVDVKVKYKEIKKEKYKNNEVILIGSVTDPYQHAEKKYCATRKILEQLCGCCCNIEILTKSDLVLRDLDIIRNMKNITIGVSLNTVDDNFRKDMESGAVSISRRIDLLKELKAQNINTYVFISPIFPAITDVGWLVEMTKQYTNQYFFENLNLRGEYKKKIMEYIKETYPEHYPLYIDIYEKKHMEYWKKKEKEISLMAEKLQLDSKLYFYHEKIKKR